MQRAYHYLCAAVFIVFGALAIGCGPTYPKCEKDSQCKEKEYCVNGLCQQCRDSHDCAKGDVCNKGRCEKPTTRSCTSDAECPADQSCIDGVCKPCASDDQCGPGGKCTKGRCARAAVTGEETPTPGPCVLEAVYFDFNDFALTTEATGAIDRDAECLKKAGTKGATLTGRSDPRGTEEYNLALSDKRTNSVKEHLTRMGIDGKRLRVVAKGELEATGTDESGWAKDRRVDFSW